MLLAIGMAVLGVGLSVAGGMLGAKVSSKYLITVTSVGLGLSLLGVFFPVVSLAVLGFYGLTAVMAVVSYPVFRKVFKKHKMVKIDNRGMYMPRLVFTMADGYKVMHRPDAEKFVKGLDQASFIASLNPLVWAVRIYWAKYEYKRSKMLNFTFQEDVTEAMNLPRLVGLVGRVYSEDSPEYEEALKYTEVGQFGNLLGSQAMAIGMTGYNPKGVAR